MAIVQLSKDINVFKSESVFLFFTTKSIMNSPYSINVNGIDLNWDTDKGICTFAGIPVAMMWIDSTLLGLMMGTQKMVGTERFLLALQAEGRNSVEDDWQVITSCQRFEDGFKKIKKVAQVAGWGNWNVIEFSQAKKTGLFRIENSWEGHYQKSLSSSWGSAFVAGKLAGYCSKAFGTNCWPIQTKFISKGDSFDEFIIQPSLKTIEEEVDKLLVSNRATKADMAVALEKLRTEIEERKQVEEQLRISEQQLKNVIDGSKLGYWDWNYVTGEQAVNDHWLAMLGLPRSDINNHINDWAGLIHPDDKQGLTLTVEEHIKSGENYVAEFRMKHADGHWVWIQGSGAVVEYNKETREPIRLCGTHQDITERKNIDVELSEHRNSLEKLVLARTKELENARNEADTANQAKSAFLSSMSHELRTPLNAILGFSQLLLYDKETPLIEDHLESVEQINEGGEHLLSLINDVLDLSKIETGNSDINIEEIDTKDFISQVAVLIKPQASQNNIIIENKVSDKDSLKIRADHKGLKQVLLNLSSNAIKYNSENGAVIFSCERSNINKIRLSVSDTGSGVSEKLFPSLFEPFNRLDKENSNIQGTGIGLTICKQLVDLMEGEIGVFINSDKGLTFWVEFEEA